MHPKERVALVKWAEHDGLTEAFYRELVQLGFEVTTFLYCDQIPETAELLFSFGPYGRWMSLVRQVGQRKARSALKFVHWNTENPPDLRIPWNLQSGLGKWRASFDRLYDSPGNGTRRLLNSFPLSVLNRKMLKFRYLGEYRYAFSGGYLDELAFSSHIYADLFSRHNMPASYVPWGTSPTWHANLNLPRDIDVLWFGKRRTRRRDRLLQKITDSLRSQNIQVFLADTIEHPFIYGEERIRILNRAKITLNLLPTWYDNAFPYRFHVAAGNRSLVVSETILPHCPEYQPGVHYVSVSSDKVTDAIQYYLEHQDEMDKITENAFQLVTKQMTMQNSVRSLLSST